MAEKMVTLGKRGTLADRRRAISLLRQKDRVAELFSDIAPGYAGRAGGYTRIIKVGRRQGDNAEQAILEWVDRAVVAPKQSTVEKRASDNGGISVVAGGFEGLIRC